MYHRFSKMRLYFRRMIQYIRRGGVVYANISQIQRGDVLKGKRVLVTGGTSGIGFAIAQKFISEGAIVAITGRNKEKLHKAVEQLGPNAYGFEWDVADVAIIPQKVKEVVTRLQGIDILVNNAGVYSTASFSKVTMNEWDRVFDINLKGPFFLTREVIHSVFIPNGGGKILNISSVRGFQGDIAPYGISKWGMIGFTKGLAREYSSKNIAVNSIAPGMTASEINGITALDNLFANGPERNQRIAIPQDMAELALFLVSDSSNHILGQIIVCDGGSILI